MKLCIGVLPESLGLFHSLTIWEHLILTASIYKLPKWEAQECAKQLLLYLGLWDERGTYADQASYGMGKQCALAMALIHKPRVIFLDEPFEGMDPNASRNIKDLLLRLRNVGITIFLTSHILEVVELLIDDFAIISDGKIACVMSRDTLTSEVRLEEMYFSFTGRSKEGDLRWLEQ